MGIEFLINAGTASHEPYEKSMSQMIDKDEEDMS